MYVLGLELSTQSVKALVLDVDSGEIIHRQSLDYDSHLPQYKTQGGVLSSEEPGLRHTSPAMLVESLDLAFHFLQKSDVDISRIRVVKADAMQHCTVYTNKSFGNILGRLSGETPLLKQLEPAFSRATSPIWEDRTPEQEAAYLTEAIAPLGGVLALTGNPVELRFPAVQILKWAREHPEEYTETAHIFCLSAFVTSLLSGNIAPVDTGDGWGTNMNTVDIDNPGWSFPMLKIMDAYLNAHGVKHPALDRKLGVMVPYDHPLGTISPYFVDRYGLSPKTKVLAGTGDNPATLLGCGGGTVISLGSSYTVNGMASLFTAKDQEHNLFGYTPGNTMALTVFTNGAKVHDHFLNSSLKCAPSPQSWSRYLGLAGDPPLTPDENLLLPYLNPESVPCAPAGIIPGFDARDAGASIRALCLSQVLSLRLHSEHIQHADRICVVGGGAQNSLMMQWLADAFNALTYHIQTPSFAAPMGCAISGARALLGCTYEDVSIKYVRESKGSVWQPIKANVKSMEGLLTRFHELEKQHKL